MTDIDLAIKYFKKHTVRCADCSRNYDNSCSGVMNVKCISYRLALEALEKLNTDGLMVEEEDTLDLNIENIIEETKVELGMEAPLEGKADLIDRLENKKPLNLPLFKEICKKSGVKIVENSKDPGIHCGKWKLSNREDWIGHTFGFTCPNCDYFHTSPSRYCPDCGLDMEFRD